MPTNVIEGPGASENKAWTWQQNVTACAERMSKKIEEAFVFEMKKADTFLPYKHSECNDDEISAQKMCQLEIFIDYTIGTTTAILGHYASLEPDFETHMIEMVKDKFERLRTIKKLEAANEEHPHGNA